MKRTYKVKLQDTASIQDTINSLTAYKDGLAAKAALIRNRLAEKLRDYSDTGFGAAVQHIWQFSKTGFVKADEPLRMPRVSVSVVSEDRTIVVAESEDVLFIEFGTGVYHNASRPNEYYANAVSPKMIIGEYGYGNGKKNKWAFKDDAGEKWWTHGMAATPAMEVAMNTVCTELLDIAWEVWK